MTPRANLLVTLVLGLGAIACGYKAPPLPPPLKHPATTTDLSIQQRGEELILQFTYPLTTFGGLPLEKIEKVEYWELVKPLAPPEEAETEGESEGEDGGVEDEPAETGEDEVDETTPEETPEEPQEEVLPRGATPEVPLPPDPTKEQIAAVELLEFEATAQVRLVLEAEELTAATVGDKIVLRLPFPGPAEEETGYVYAVKTFSDDRRVSSWSNLVTLVRREPPPAPAEFEIEALAGGVRVTWYNQLAEDRREELRKAAEAGEPPPLTTPLTDEERKDATLVKSYRIYRRDAQARSYGEHIGLAPTETDEYLDRTAQYGNRYIYSLTAVGLTFPLVQSALAGEIEVDYQDRFAPPAPVNVVALAEPGRVRILWDASPAPDLRGYLVFRRQRGVGEFEQLNTRPIVDLEYNDRDVTAGTEYEYRVAAIDRVGNEGSQGATVTARVP